MVGAVFDGGIVGMIKQKDFQSFNIKNGVQVLMDNGDVATIRDELDGWGIHITRPDLTHFMHERQRSKHVVTCLIYAYPDTDI